MSDTIIAAIITGVISIVVGFITGYSYCLKIKVKKVQKQKAKNNATLFQVGEINVKK